MTPLQAFHTMQKILYWIKCVTIALKESHTNQKENFMKLHLYSLVAAACTIAALHGTASTNMDHKDNTKQQAEQKLSPAQQKDLNKCKADQERMDSMSPDQKAALATNDWNAFVQATEARQKAEADAQAAAVAAQKLPHRDPSQRAFWKTDEEFERHQAAMQRRHKRQQQWTDGVEPVIQHPAPQESAPVLQADVNPDNNLLAESAVLITLAQENKQ